MSRKLFDADAMFYADADISGWTTATGTYNSASVDLGVADADKKPAAVAQIAFTGEDSASSTAVLTISIQDSADDSSFADIIILEDHIVTVADLDDIQIPIPTKNVRQYVRMSTIVTVANLNAGVLNAGIVK
jgi:hypothetical protein